MAIEKSSGIYRFSVITACSVIVLLIAGALVTSNNAADSVPDWPLAYGKLIPPLVGGVRFEYTHRVVAGIVAILTAVLAIWLAAGNSSRTARKLGWTALGLVIAQALLGALRVLEGHAAVSATAHATLAQVFFVTVVSLALYISPWWQRTQPSLEDSGSPGLRTLALLTTLAIVAQLVMGAGYRHGAWGIPPHLIGAVVVTFLIVWTGRVVRKRCGKVRDLRRWGILLQALLGIQLLLGGAAYWATIRYRDSVQPMPLFILWTVAHVLVGAMILAASVLLTLSAYRLMRPSTRVAAESGAEQPVMRYS